MNLLTRFFSNTKVKYDVMNKLIDEIEARDSDLENRKVDKTTTVNNKSLTGNITINQDDVASGTTNKAYTAIEQSKLSGVATGATKVDQSSTNGNIRINDVEKQVYAHPNTHTASMIVEDVAKRFVSDTEKATWNGKTTTSINDVATNVNFIEENGLLKQLNKFKIVGASVQGTINLFNKYDILLDKTFNTSMVIADKVGAIVTNFIDLPTDSSGKYLVFTMENSAKDARALIKNQFTPTWFEDENGVKISFTSTINSAGYVVIPEGAKRARFGIANNLTTRNLMIEVRDDTTFDTSITAYKEYSDTLLIDEEVKIAYANFDEKLKSQISSIESDISYLNNKMDSSVGNSATGMTWSWWVTNTIVSSTDTLFFGYIRKTGEIGVGSRCVDGTILTKNLFTSNSVDDHNACGVSLLEDGRVIVIFTEGHSANNKVHVVIFNEPNTIDCAYSEKIVLISDTYNSTCKTTYSQIFIRGTTIYNFFRAVVEDTVNSITYVVWKVMKSTDNGETFVCYDLLRDAVASPYISIKNVLDDSNLLRIVTYPNPRQQVYSYIRSGFLNIATGDILNANGSSVLGNIYSNGFTGIEMATFDYAVNKNSGLRTRLLDVAETNKDTLAFIYARSTDGTFVNFNIYRYLNGQNLEIGLSGVPFLKYSSYLDGCVFNYSINNIVLFTNNNGVYEVKNLLIDNTNISSKTLDVSKNLLSRPFNYGFNKVAYSVGVYNDTSTVDTSGTFGEWDMNVRFLEFV